MRNIAKAREPNSLTAWRVTNPENFEGYTDKQALRASLAEEQRNICCYCMGRIRPEIGLMKIEHWRSQSGYPALRLVYANLLGACMGGDGQRVADKHCDTSKGSQDFSRNPAEPTHNVQAFLRYLPDGSLEATDPVLSEQLDTVLNLNLSFLKNNRKAALESVTKMLGLRGGALNRNQWEKIIADFTGASGASELQPYCGVIIYWARKHLAQFG